MNHHDGEVRLSHQCIHFETKQKLFRQAFFGIFFPYNIHIITMYNVGLFLLGGLSFTICLILFFKAYNVANATDRYLSTSDGKSKAKVIKMITFA